LLALVVGEVDFGGFSHAVEFIKSNWTKH
jgi:hypothetical protein